MESTHFVDVDADRIKAMRLERGWTQEQIAEMCDVSVRTIQRIEKNRRGIFGHCVCARRSSRYRAAGTA